MYRTEAFVPQAVQLLHPQEATIWYRQQHDFIF